MDDESFIRMALKEALRTWGYSVVEADSVASAMKVFVSLDVRAFLPKPFSAEAILTELSSILSRRE